MGDVPLDFATGFFTGAIAVLVTGVALHVTGEADDMTTEELWWAAGSAFATGFALGSGMEIPSFGGLINEEKFKSNSNTSKTAVKSVSMSRNPPTDPDPTYLNGSTPNVTIRANRKKATFENLFNFGSPIRRNFNSEASRGNLLILKGDISISKYAPSGLRGTAKEISSIAFYGIGGSLIAPLSSLLLGSGSLQGLGVYIGNYTRATIGQRALSFSGDFISQYHSSLILGEEFRYNLSGGISSAIFAAPKSSSLMIQNFLSNGFNLTHDPTGGMNFDYDITKGLISGGLGYGAGYLNVEIFNKSIITPSSQILSRYGYTLYTSSIKTGITIGF